MDEIYVIGGGGTARDVVGALENHREFRVAALVVPEKEKEKVANWFPKILSDDEFEDIISKIRTTIKVCIAISNTMIRKKLVEKLSRFSNIEFPNIFFEKPKIIGGKVKIGVGNIIYHNVSVSQYADIGSWNIINANVWIPHDVLIENFTTVEMEASIGGGVTIKEGATIAAGAVLLPRITVGRFATVGLGAVVFKDVPEKTTVIGNPSKRIFSR